MTLYTNNAEGGTHPDAVTTGNSGGDSGTAWTAVQTAGSNTATFNSTAIDGSLSYLLTAPTAASNCRLDWGGNVGSASQGAMRWKVRLASNVGTAPFANLFALTGAFGTVFWINIENSANKITYSDAGQVIRHTMTNGLALDTDYTIEVNFNRGASAGQGTINLRYYLGNDSGTIIEEANLTSQALGSANVERVYFGKGGTGTVTMRMDSIAYENTTAAYLGPAVTPVAGVADYDVSIAVPQNTTARSGWVYTIDTTGSTGATTLVWDGTSRGTITESPTGVFTITDPDDGDAALALVLTAAGVDGGADDVVNLSVPRGGAATRPKTLTFQGGTWSDRANWG